MSSNENQKWLSEYEAFLKTEAAPVPKEVSNQIFTRMQELINPNAWHVFGKLFGIHVVVGFLSLSVCHQFDMNPFGTKTSLADWFMSMWGHSVCMILCGALFLSVSVLSAGYFLSIEEMRSLKRTEFIQTLALGVLSLGIFAISGAQLAVTFAGLWLLGALVGGLVATEAAWKLRRT